MIRDHHFIIPPCEEILFAQKSVFSSIVNVVLVKLSVDVLLIALPICHHFNIVAVVCGALGIRCIQPLQLLFQTDYTVRQLLVD